jgi:putative ABC transport system substrate-binding protein
MLFNPASATYAEYWLNPFKAAATSFAVEAITAPVRERLPDSFMDAHRVEITSLAARYRLPAVYNTRVFAEVGGLLSSLQRNKPLRGHSPARWRKLRLMA